MQTLTRIVLVVALLLAAGAGVRATTTGSVIGRVADEQGAAVPGVDRHRHEQRHRLRARRRLPTRKASTASPPCPVGAYDVVDELRASRASSATTSPSTSSRRSTSTLTLRVAQVAETVTVTATRRSSRRSSSALGEVVDLARIESLPLNGRQFANLAATVPGVGLGFHSDVTKSAQYTPQISGGNGRNLNYLVDGGDNNDDTIGGLLQLFPLEAIQEFNVMTQRLRRGVRPQQRRACSTS